MIRVEHGGGVDCAQIQGYSIAEYGIMCFALCTRDALEIRAS